MMNKFYGNNSNNNIVGMIEIGNWSLDIRDLILEPEPFAKGILCWLFVIECCLFSVCLVFVHFL